MQIEGKTWNDEFRPKTIATCILPKRIKPALLALERTGIYPHLLLVGPPGVGKTSVARILCNHPNVHKGTVDFTTTGAKDIKEAFELVESFMKGGTLLAHLSSARAKRRVIFIDESQVLTPQHQEKLKLLMEWENVTATFMLLINDDSKLSLALKSRMVKFNFKPIKDEDDDMLVHMLARCKEIVAQKNANLAEDEIISIVENFFPDMRTIINELYKASIIKVA